MSSLSDDLVFSPCFSLTPTQCVAFNKVDRRSRMTDDGGIFYRPSFTPSVKRAFHNFNISQNAYRSLKQKINWLYFLSKSRYVKTYSGREIFNFRMAFLTLTLPAKQKSPTIDITQRLFNQFLTEIRSRTEMRNYVWRLEFQKNGNVHYHIATDTYLDYFFVRKIWNRILEKDGYISDFQSKFKNLSLIEYNKLVNASGAISFNKIAKRYADGCKNQWSQPNSVDVVSVVSKTAIANYISKYFGKDSNGGKSCNELDNPDNSKSLRLWFCSRHLSKLKTVSEFLATVNYDIFSIVKLAKGCRTVVLKYATVFFFDIFNLPDKMRFFVHRLLRDYAIKQGYFT